MRGVTLRASPVSAFRVRGRVSACGRPPLVSNPSICVRHSNPPHSTSAQLYESTRCEAARAGFDINEEGAQGKNDKARAAEATPPSPAAAAAAPLLLPPLCGAAPQPFISSQRSHLMSLRLACLFVSASFSPSRAGARIKSPPEGAPVGKGLFRGRAPGPDRGVQPEQDPRGRGCAHGCISTLPCLESSSSSEGRKTRPVEKRPSTHCGAHTLSRTHPTHPPTHCGCTGTLIVEYGAAKYKPNDIDLVMNFSDVMIVNYGGEAQSINRSFLFTAPAAGHVSFHSRLLVAAESPLPRPCESCHRETQRDTMDQALNACFPVCVSPFPGLHYEGSSLEEYEADMEKLVAHLEARIATDGH